MHGDATSLVANGPFWAIIRQTGEVEVGGEAYAGDTGPVNDAPAVGRVPHVTAVALHRFSTCLLLGNPGRVRCRLGSARVDARRYPESDGLRVRDVDMGLQDAVEIAAGDDYTCARRAAGKVLCWGSSGSPAPVPGLDDAEALYPGAYSACARRVGGSLACWGKLERGYVRFEPSKSSSYLTGATKVAIGGHHGCALFSDGHIGCFGENYQGELGDGSIETVLAPTAVTGLVRAP